MRESGSSRDHGGNCTITVAGTQAEIDMVRAALTGAAWLVQQDDGPRQTPFYQPLPDPIADPIVPPSWSVKVPALGSAPPDEIKRMIEQAERAPRPATVNVREDLEPDEGYHWPSFYVKYLVGYNGRVTTYAAEAGKLMAWGFECLRSRRGPDGMFWELWYLPSALFARGRLKDELDKMPKNMAWNAQSRAVVEFLCHHCAFGSMDVTVQRAAMTVD